MNYIILLATTRPDTKWQPGSCVACRCLSLCSDLSNVVAGRWRSVEALAACTGWSPMGVADGVVNHPNGSNGSRGRNSTAASQSRAVRPIRQVARVFSSPSRIRDVVPSNVVRSSGTDGSRSLHPHFAASTAPMLKAVAGGNVEFPNAVANASHLGTGTTPIKD
ncbi:hypothetical protein Bca52824_057652 [Brassica carinata]|uniref:Uncharacterized protein n=1 Tax=Brassica carinata TaxID=52824 RepID=A0A8X7QSH6_BRACI|nr:hypothetical protein Bca52824_057652 [Brassica carinata]